MIIKYLKGKSEHLIPIPWAHCPALETYIIEVHDMV
jgi:hypothetical protein